MYFRSENVVISETVIGGMDVEWVGKPTLEEERGVDFGTWRTF